MRAGWTQFRTCEAKGAHLVPVEALKDIPFSIKRVFYVFDAVPDSVRGGHAHREGQEVLVCLRGTCQLTLHDGQMPRTFNLDRLDRGVFVPKLHWLEYQLSADAVLLAFADRDYDPGDTLRDFQSFLALVNDEA